MPKSELPFIPVKLVEKLPEWGKGESLAEEKGEPAKVLKGSAGPLEAANGDDAVVLPGKGESVEEGKEGWEEEGGMTEEEGNASNPGEKESWASKEEWF